MIATPSQTDSTNCTDPIVQFATIERYPGYRFGDDGSVWSSLRRQGSFEYKPSDQWRKLRPSKNSDGYMLIHLKSSDGTIHRCLTVHTLILEAFVGPCPPNCEARHFPDGNRSNNAKSNLIWGTRSENFYDKWHQGTMPHGENHHQSMLTEDSVREIRRRKSAGESLSKLAAAFAVNKTTVARVIRGESWQWLK